LTLDTVTRLPANVGNAFPDFLLAVLSWVTAEFLAGCAAYAQAMYFVPANIENSASTREGAEWAESSVAECAKSLDAAQIPQPAQSAYPPSRRYSSISAQIRALLSSLRESRIRRQAVLELKALDDKTLRDIGLTRCKIESAVRGDCRRE
jgi:uncharacterized protein YjiS (DUF1127 family)